MSIFPGFGGAPSPPPPPPPPPPIPERTDPAVEQASKNLAASEARRRGRASSILTSGQGVQGGSLARPEADDNSVLG